MGFLKEIKKALFGAKAASRSMADKVRGSGEEMAKPASQALEEQEKVAARDMFKEPETTKGQQGETDDFDLFADTAERSATGGTDTPTDHDEDLDRLFEDEEEPAAEPKGKKHGTGTSEQARKFQQEAEEIGDEILRKGGQALEGARTLAGKFFEKAGDLVERAQKEAAEELDKKVEAARKLEEKLEKEKRKYEDPRKNIFEDNEDLLSEHDDFFEKARRFAEGDYQNEGKKTPSGKMDIQRDPDFKARDKTGTVPGFEDLDGDGDEIIDDAIIDDDDETP